MLTELSNVFISTAITCPLFLRSSAAFLTYRYDIGRPCGSKALVRIVASMLSGEQDFTVLPSVLYLMLENPSNLTRKASLASFPRGCACIP